MAKIKQQLNESQNSIELTRQEIQFYKLLRAQSNSNTHREIVEKQKRLEELLNVIGEQEKVNAKLREKEKEKKGSLENLYRQAKK